MKFSDKISWAYPSRCLSLLEQQPPHDNKLRILDIGYVSQATLNFFPAERSKFSILGCDTPQSIIQHFSQAQCSKYDIILAWDLLNYLSLDELSAVLPKIQNLTLPNGLIYLFSIDNHSMPKTPSQFQIMTVNELAIFSCEEKVKSPRYTQPILKKLLTACSLQRNQLLRNGFQEYLWRKNDMNHNG